VIGCALLKVLLDAVLIARFGLSGAVVAYVAVTVVNAIAVMALAIKVSHATPDWGKLGRIVLAAACAGLVALPLHGHLPPVLEVIAGGIVLAATYLPMTMLLRCWSRGDIEHMQQLYRRYAPGRPRVGVRFLDWAYSRADEGRVP
jgi:O-antigen/teichoic acid export membrane protein